MWELPNALIAATINNLLHAVWFYCLVLKPKFSRKPMFCVFGGNFFFHEAFTFFSMEKPFTSPLFALHYGAGFMLDLVLCVQMSSVQPAKTIFIYSIYQNTWAFIFTLQMLLSTNALTWNLLRLGLSLTFLALFLWRLKDYYLRVSENIETSYGLLAAIPVFVWVALNFIVFYVVYTEHYSVAAVAAIALIMMFVLIVDILLFVVMANLNWKQQLVYMDLQQRILSSQVESCEQMEQEAHRLQHDQRHHIMAIAELARGKDYQGILDYLAQAKADLPRRFCDNRVVNSIVSAYTRKARQGGIELRPDIVMGTRTQISDTDFVVILANMLENALRACKEAGGRQVELYIKKHETKLVICCENPCGADLTLEGEIPRARDHEGIGVKSILRAADRYSGDVNFTASGGRFQCMVLLNDLPD